ncbi:transposase [Nonomuraea sp. NPDC050451]|uniref:transposase n=1 Tax=Nonomuraea sp. NPDC050451 TaxID=3364364 RepID=UPI0037996F57
MATSAVTRRFDLTDAQWVALEPLLPAPKRAGRPSLFSKRQLIDGTATRSVMSGAVRRWCGRPAPRPAARRTRPELARIVDDALDDPDPWRGLTAGRLDHRGNDDGGLALLFLTDISGP